MTPTARTAVGGCGRIPTVKIKCLGDRHGAGLVFRRAVVDPRFDRNAALDLVQNLDGAFGNRRRDCCTAHHWRAHRHGSAGSQVGMGQFPCGHRSNCADVSGWRGADPGIFRTKWKEAMGVGLVGFFGPFLGAAAVARYVLGWSVPSSWLAGVACPRLRWPWCTRLCSNSP